jgi:hypothetical protein
VTSRVRDAMLKDPRALSATATAQEAGALLARPEVVSVLVVDGERLLGRVTPVQLVAGVVAAGPGAARGSSSWRAWPRPAPPRRRRFSATSSSATC